jgi:hypothetical protein
LNPFGRINKLFKLDRISVASDTMGFNSTII